MGSCECTIHNETSHPLHINTNYYYEDKHSTINPGAKFTWKVDTNATYQEFHIGREHEINDPIRRPVLFGDDMAEWEEISIVTPEDDVEDKWVGTKLREPTISGQERDDYEAVKNETSARMKRILSRTSKLELHLKNIKICPAQSKHLVQTFSKGIQEMAENYTKVFGVQSNVVRLYKTRKLRILLKVVYSLQNCVRDAEEFLLECQREWKLLALQVSVPCASPATTLRSKFDLLICELCWTLDKIRYALWLENKSSRVEWTWCPIRIRHVLIEKACGGDVEHGGLDIGDSSLEYRDSDRLNLSRQLEDRSTHAQDHFFNIFKPWMCLPQIGSGEAFGEILKKRLCSERCISPTSTSSSIPVKNFQINHLDLKYKSTKLLHQGSSKNVFKGEWYGLEVAIATMEEKESPVESLVENEARFLVELQHPNIVAFYGYSCTRDPRLSGPESPTAAAYLVMELMEGDLLQTIKSRWRSTGPFSISVTLDIMLQIVEAMVYLHEHSIMHGGLQPSNFLVKSRSGPPDVYYTVKLTDFGSAAREVDTESTSDLFSVRPGTMRWMAPEMLGTKDNSERVKYTKSADVYGFAIICYQVVTGVDLPMPEISAGDVIQEVRSGARPLFPASVSCPEGLKQLIINCWHEERDSRPSFIEIRERLWTLRKDIELQA